MHTIVRTKDGELRGTQEENVLGGKYFAFKSIPYAKSPLGQLRFKDPQPPMPWKGVRDATKFGSWCAQCNPNIRKIIGSDDCLFLNVYTPSINAGAKLPVMFYIHGGSFRSGSAAAYSPDYLVRRNVVLVTINYRLGVFGFLNLEDEAVPGNQGLKDQVMALKWVQRNIEDFSGDPDNVTIFGESAGGAIVHFLTLSPLSKGLFHKAICQSGCAINTWTMIRESSKEVAIRIAARLGLETDDPEAIVDFFRTVDAHDLIEAQESIITPEYDWKYISPLAPSLDTKSANPFFPEHPEELYKQGVHVPLLIGYTSNEGAFLTRKSVSVRNIRYDEAHYNMLNTKFEQFVNPVDMKFLEKAGMTPNDLKFHYYGDDVIAPRNIQKFADFISDSLFIRGIYKAVDMQLEKSKSPTYIYKFSYDKGLSMIKSHLPKELQSGATHCDDLIYLFYDAHYGKLVLNPNSVDHLIMQRVTELWTNFARTGNPTPEVTTTVPLIWEPVKKGNAYQLLNIDEPISMESVEKGKQRCDWDRPKNRL